MVELGRGSVSALHPACTLNRGGFVMQDQITIDSFVESMFGVSGFAVGQIRRGKQYKDVR